jgi:hypothetical protein
MHDMSEGLKLEKVEMKQLFELAGMFFVCGTDTTADEQEDIKTRFEKILDSFLIPDKHYTKNSKTDNSELPYNSGVRMKGSYCVEIGDYLVLHFASSYKEPLMFMYNIKTATVYNYIEYDVAKMILDDDIYEAVFSGLHQRRVMDGMLKGVADLDKFIEQYVIAKQGKEGCYKIHLS